MIRKLSKEEFNIYNYTHVWRIFFYNPTSENSSSCFPDYSQLHQVPHEKYEARITL